MIFMKIHTSFSLHNFIVVVHISWCGKTDRGASDSNQGLLSSLALKVEDPGRQALSRHNHASGVGQIRLCLELDLQVSDLARVEGTRQLGGQREISVVKVDDKLALLI